MLLNFNLQQVKFTEFGFSHQLMEGIEASNYEVATPIQEKVIPHILNGRDVLAFAQTGTGKTAAFLLPLINQMLVNGTSENSINALIIVPTRELAVQIAQQLEGLSYFTSISSIAVYGGGDGHHFIQEKKALSSGVDFVVCTPGKMMAHIKMGYVKMKDLQFLVLDEADRMLDMGFYDDINFIVNHLPPNRQNLLFSATMPPKIKTLARDILKDPIEANIALSKPPDKIVQQAYMVYDEQKVPLVQHILVTHPNKSVLIFCGSKTSVRQLTKDLKRNGIQAGEIHSDLEQEHREDVLMKYKSGRLQVLVATDILSRGIDIDHIELIINFDVPHDGEDYIHRVGRTARAEAEGSAFTLINPRDQRKFGAIERLIGKEIQKMDIPPQLGKQPIYNPGAPRGINTRKKHFNKGSRHK